MFVNKFKHYDNRPDSGYRGYDSKWQKIRKIKITNNPLCESCANHDIDRLANVVHHIIAIEKAPELRLTMSNLMSLCAECHESLHGRLIIKGCDINGLPIDAKHPWYK